MRLFSILILLSLLWGCKSAERYYEKGKYDLAIDKSISQLKKREPKEKHIEILRKSYHAANDESLEKIRQLKMEGDPADWEIIYEEYLRLSQRNVEISSLPKTIMDQIASDFPTYTSDLENAKQKTVEYLYARSQKLLITKSIQSSRQAYELLSKINYYYAEYKDKDSLMMVAKKQGIIKVLIKTIESKQYVKFPYEMRDELSKINPRALDSEWIQFHDVQSLNVRYDYIVSLDFDNWTVRPLSTSSRKYSEEKVITEDSKDSTKSKESIVVKANVEEFIFSTSAKLSCRVSLLNCKTNEIENSERLYGEAHYTASWVKVLNGDLRALDAETLAKTQTKPNQHPDYTSISILACKDLTFKVGKEIDSYKIKYLK